jgi:uridine phosphorylase
MFSLGRPSNNLNPFKVGPVLSVSHGIGVTSLGVVLHEIIKLMYHAKCKDPTFIRIGTSGGVGIEGGTVVVSNGAVDERLRDTYEMVRSFAFLGFVLTSY